MKAKHAFIVLIALVSNVIQMVQSSEVRIGMHAVGVYDASTAVTINKGTEMLNKGDYEKARQYYDAAIIREPRSWAGYFNRSYVFIHQQKWDLALQDVNTVIRLKPSVFMATIMRAEINARLGRYSSSLADLDRILSLRPMANTQAYVLNGRAWIRATCPNASFRNGQQAVNDAKGACNITNWGNADYIDTLGAACAEAGDFDAAVRYEEKAIALSHDAASSTEAQRRLAIYRQHQPFRAH